MSNIIYLDKDTAAVMNLLKQDIKYLETVNSDGSRSEAILKEKAILRSFMKQLMSVPADPLVEAA